MDSISISIIGTGKLARHLAKALQDAGYSIDLIIGRNQERTQALAQQLKVRYSLNPGDLPSESGLVFLCVSDGAIAQMAQKLTDTGATFVHCSGALPMDELSCFSNYGVLYPLYTFSENKPVDFSSIPLFIEGKHPRALDEINAVAQKLSSTVVTLSGNQRKVLHLAAVFVNNFVNFNYIVADKVLKDNGLEFAYLLPIINETTKKVETLNPRDAQTGPALRNDLGTMMSHLELLSDYPGYQKIYSFVSDAIANEFQNKKTQGPGLWDILKPD